MKVNAKQNLLDTSARTFSALCTAFVTASILGATSGAYTLTGPNSSLLELSFSEALEMTTKTSDFAYRISVDSGEAEVAVYQQASPTAYEVQSYHCHSELDATGALAGAHCHDEGVAAPVSHQLPAKTIGRSGLLAAVSSALSIFESRIAKVNSISELKLWQHGDDMTIRITSGDPAAQVVSLFGCHKHGADYDCHRTRKAGPNEPAN